VASLRGETPERAVEAGDLLGLVDEEGDLAGSRYSLGLRFEARSILDPVPAREHFVDVDEGGIGVLGAESLGEELEDAALPDASLAGDQLDEGRTGEEPETLEIARPRDKVIMHVSNIMDKKDIVSTSVHHDGQRAYA